MDHEKDNTTGDEHYSILTKLIDMFGEVVSTEDVIAVCTSFNWQMADCIESLIKLGQENNCSRDNLVTCKDQIVCEAQNSIVGELNVCEMDRENRKLGAIPKQTGRTSNIAPNNQLNVQRRSQNNRASKNMVRQQQTRTQRSAVASVKQLEPLIKQLHDGYKVMILLRGVPGSGKSYLARQIVDEVVNGSEYRNHICSSDDYFVDRNGNYVYRPDELSIAHDMNQRQVRNKAAEGWSPLIVDNTNIKQWEMFAYVKIAVNYDYVIKIVEPNTYWSKSAGKCAVKNGHGVPKDKIQRMLDTYESTTVSNLIQLCNVQYNVQLPQLRLQPPITVGKSTSRQTPTPNLLATDSDAANQHSEDDEIFLVSGEKEQSQHYIETNDSDEKNSNALSNNNTENWKSFEHQSVEFWQREQTNNQVLCTLSLPKPQRRNFLSKDDTFKLHSVNPDSVKHGVKEDEDLITFDFDQQKSDSIEAKSKESDFHSQAANETFAKLDRHAIDCFNQNKNFTTLRQIYPNKQLDGLWDLFEKCHGDIDWAVDILLKDDSCVDKQSDVLLPELFQCNCKMKLTQSDDMPLNYENYVNDDDTSMRQSSSPKRQRAKRDKSNKTAKELQEIKKTIETQFCIGDQYYSTQLKKIRDARHKINLNNPPTNNADENLENNETPAASVHKENDDSETEDDTVEIILGDALLEQLANIFKLDVIPKNMIKNLKTNVVVPKSLAYQLYLVWVESVFNQVEEQRFKSLNEDTELAKVLSLQANFKKAIEIKRLSAELVNDFYNSEHNCWDSNAEDLASQLTKLKLAEEFPNIAQQTLLETFESTENQYADTVQILQDTFNQNERRLEVEEKVLRDRFCSNDVVDEITLDSTSEAGKNVNEEDAKKIALHNFEENRNMAVHHSQLKAECYQKAKEAIQKGNTAVAVYYSQIADLHKQKIDTFNHIAANYIVAVHDVTQNNPDFIDLHYLHVAEAEQCLDVFIDRHIQKLKSVKKSYKYIFIITGRGLHSAYGVSIIKNKVKHRLKDRNLKWIEINPGLLKVKVFSTSQLFTKTYA